MQANPGHGGQPVTQQIEDGTHPVWQGHHVDIVQLQMTLDVLQRIVYAKEEQWHEGVTLFATLMLLKGVSLPFFILPKVMNTPVSQKGANSGILALHATWTTWPSKHGHTLPQSPKTTQFNGLSSVAALMV